MQKLTNILCFLLLATSIYAQQKEVCFTVDDLPVVTYRDKSMQFQLNVTEELVQVLKAHNIPAIGFVNEFKMYNGENVVPLKINLLKLWLENGLDLGNHSFSHSDYHKVSFDYFTNDIKKGEIISASLCQKYGKAYRYFRHPFLHIGQTKERADSLSAFLKQNNYIEAPVTIDNSDYLFAVAYDSVMSINDFKLMAKIGADYIDYMERKLHYFESLSNKLFQRNIGQILLIHANSLNGDYLERLVGMYIKNGYQFKSLEDILKDKAYETEVTKFSNWGISWLDRWALSAGKDGDFFKDDPRTPEYILKLAKTESE